MHLSQFTVLNYEMMAEDNDTRIKVYFILRRIFYGHLTNTYMPTFGLLLIAVITLQFDESKMELALGLTLTIMLVMYTMYQSISVAVTTTAYLKFLDYWLFFCLLMPFVIFMIETYWFLQKNKHLNMTTDKHGWVEDEKKFQGKKKVCSYITYAFTITFVVIYVILAITFYHTAPEA